MAKYSELPPPKSVPLPYRDERTRGIQFFFEDPDCVNMNQDYPFKVGNFEISWATSLTACKSLDVLGKVIEQEKLKRGTVLLRRTPRSGDIFAGSNILRGLAEDIVGEVEESEPRVAMYTLGNKHLDLSWSLAWPKDFHDVPSNEIVMNFKDWQGSARMIIDQCIADTALPDLRKEVDGVLDIFAGLETSLARSV